MTPLSTTADIIPLTEEFKNIMKPIRDQVIDFCKNYWLKAIDQALVTFIQFSLEGEKLDTPHVTKFNDPETINDLLILSNSGKTPFLHKFATSDIYKFSGITITYKDNSLIPTASLQPYTESYLSKFIKKPILGCKLSYWIYDTKFDESFMDSFIGFLKYAFSFIKQHIPTFPEYTPLPCPEYIRLAPRFYYLFYENDWVFGHTVLLRVIYGGRDSLHYCLSPYVCYQFTDAELNLLLKEEKINELIMALERTAVVDVLDHMRRAKDSLARS